MFTQPVSLSHSYEFLSFYIHSLLRFNLKSIQVNPILPCGDMLTFLQQTNLNNIAANIYRLMMSSLSSMMSNALFTTMYLAVFKIKLIYTFNDMCHTFA